MTEDKFRPHTVLVSQDEEIVEIHRMESLTDALDRMTDLQLEELKAKRTRPTELREIGPPKWYRVAPSDEVEEDL